MAEIPQDLCNFDMYYVYDELVKTQRQTIRTEDITLDNIELHFNAIASILDDGIEKDYVQNMRIDIEFPDPDDNISLYIIQYLFNLMMWTLIVNRNIPITGEYIFFEKATTQGVFIKYINKYFVKRVLKDMDIIKINNVIDDCVGKFRRYNNYQGYLANTLNLKDTVDMMEKYPEFEKTFHYTAEGVPFEDINNSAQKVTDHQIEYIMSDEDDHCLKYSFISQEGTNKKQFREVDTMIGTKPNGKGSAFSHIITHSFINGGLQEMEDFLVDSSIGRIAQIISKQNVGQSGAFARKLGINNIDSKLHYNPDYICDTKNFMQVTIENEKFLEIFDMRYYRFKPNGPEYLLDADEDEDLIGQTLYFRSPMTCASAANGSGVCYRCYGNLAYAVRNINIGQIAADGLSSKYTQRMLSAKHLLESAIIKLQWSDMFYLLFAVEFDQIGLKDDFDYRKYTLILDADDIIENESDDTESEDEYQEVMDEPFYVYSFKVRDDRTGEIYDISTNSQDQIFISKDFTELIDQATLNDDDQYEFPMSKLTNICLFIVPTQNDELSKVMKQVKNLIDNKGSIKMHTKDSLLTEFIRANLNGGIKINSVHFEILLMNQMRAANNKLEYPDWNITNAPYQIITLDNSLTNNPRISVRLQSSKLKRTMINPDNNELYRSSMLDLFGLIYPQGFLSGEFAEDIDNAPPEIQEALIFN